MPFPFISSYLSWGQWKTTNLKLSFIPEIPTFASLASKHSANVKFYPPPSSLPSFLLPPLPKWELERRTMFSGHFTQGISHIHVLSLYYLDIISKIINLSFSLVWERENSVHCYTLFTLFAV